MRIVRPTGNRGATRRLPKRLTRARIWGRFSEDGHGGRLSGGDFMMRKVLFGIAAGLVLVSADVRAEDNDTADQKVAADKAKVDADIKAVNADKSKVKAAHEQV